MPTARQDASMKRASANPLLVKSQVAFSYPLQVTYLIHNSLPATCRSQQNTKEALLVLTFA